ncbi:MAG: histidinol-phosphatase [Bacteroidetes bacterium GWE2_39_28]|nr:MAG: histidinol-phosphatase [Bacteroidetes bacterium GWE2_39_28]OFY12923.1 MAG: histidinol-phosphatase [Bacteroidetes bacterium GWF2_39_10]OFZ08660.1 MAG: histidinol-phosphatase [Bacteroidetes bacterium RIFOXYB2_FULL_39_7]OFZ10474.1 MAG: histidinol-phosphatase [Bacteroidetes bacterium RIFOXYC2_FULL_39_11]
MKADLHIHSLLSPCGDIEMTPFNIVTKALGKGLSVIGITDHNSTLQCAEIVRIASREGLFVLCGAEITTKEEVHVLAFVDGESNLTKLQNYLNDHLPRVLNNTDVFGYQLVVNEKEEVLYQEDCLLISALDQTIEEVEQFINTLNGIFIPAHIDKKQNSVMSQLGFMPPGLKPDALELSPGTNAEIFRSKNKYLSGFNLIHSSDAHYLEDIGRVYTDIPVKELSFEGIKIALNSN